mmetsp:Transcript_63209/g.196122  ORF Transcript_63209/g.196122 Transcript_63209/m.196122 type:complete len:463 (+) Transcript_63209:2-1390(+)
MVLQLSSLGGEGEAIEGGGSLLYFRILRLARTVRIFRVFRLLKICQAMNFLGQVDHALVAAMREMALFGMLMMLILFVFGIIATHALFDCEDPELASSFMNLGSSIWTLFKVATMDEWTSLADRVIAVNPSMLVFFIVYIFLSVCLVSIVPAIFLETHINEQENARKREAAIVAMERKKREVAMLNRVYKSANARCASDITIGEMQRLLTNDEALSAMGFSPQEMQDMRLGFYDVWGSHLLGSEGDKAPLSQHEFLECVFSTRDQVPQVELWRAIVRSRLELEKVLQSAQADIRSLRQSVVPHTAGSSTARLSDAESRAAKAVADAAVHRAAAVAAQEAREAAERSLVTARREMRRLLMAAAHDAKETAERALAVGEPASPSDQQPPHSTGSGAADAFCRSSVVATDEAAAPDRPLMPPWPLTARSCVAGAAELAPSPTWQLEARSALQPHARQALGPFTAG